MAGAVYYARGKEYFDRGLVSSIEENDDEITACVEGTYKYQVRFWAEDGKPCYECSCPVGEDYDFCKHCVAAGLAVIAQSPPRNSAAPRMTSVIIWKRWSRMP